MALSLLCIQVGRIVSHLDFKENTKCPSKEYIITTYGNCLLVTDLVEKKMWMPGDGGINFFYSTVLNKWQIGQYKKLND